MSTIPRWLTPVAAIAVLLLLVAVMAGLLEDRIKPGLRDIENVDVSGEIEVALHRSVTLEPVPASVEAREGAVISSRLLARITAIDVRAGDQVEAGQLLLSLENSDLKARVSQAKERVRAIEARLTEARQNLVRALELHERGLIAAADRDAAQANASTLAADLAAAQQAMEEAETALGYAEIRSPIAGRVVDRFAEPGDTASPGAPILSLYNPFSLWIEARVREQLALSMATGQELAVEIPSLDRVLVARVEEIVPAADPGSRSFMVKALLPSEQGLLPGMYARLLVPAGEIIQLVIPVDRVAQVGQLDVVWVAESGVVVRRIVRLGRPAGAGRVEVLSGLAAGERVLPVPGV